MASLVSLVNLQEIHLVTVGLALASMRILAPAQNTPALPEAQDYRANFQVLKAEPRDRVGQFDVDAEIGEVEFQLVAAKQRRQGIDVHRQRGHRSIK